MKRLDRLKTVHNLTRRERACLSAQSRSGWADPLFRLLTFPATGNLGPMRFRGYSIGSIPSVTECLPRFRVSQQVVPVHAQVHRATSKNRTSATSLGPVHYCSHRIIATSVQRSFHAFELYKFRYGNRRRFFFISSQYACRFCNANLKNLISFGRCFFNIMCFTMQDCAAHRSCEQAATRGTCRPAEIKCRRVCAENFARESARAFIDE